MQNPGRWNLFIAKWWPVLAIAAVLVALDQLTKAIVTSTLSLGQSWLASSPVRITYVRNSGSAFGLFHNQTLPLIIASFLAIGFILYYFRKTSRSPALIIIALGMQLGGAIGNLADRIRLGYVVDFIDFRVWPVFNAADSSISISIVMLAVYLLFFDKPRPAPNAPVGAPLSIGEPAQPAPITALGADSLPRAEPPPAADREA